jgi:putative ABC transport system substrate-binding protein
VAADSTSVPAYYALAEATFSTSVIDPAIAAHRERRRGDRMRRRSIITAVAAAALCALGSRAAAPQPAHVFRVGLLIPVSAETFEALFATLRDELAARDYVEGRNLVFDAVYADGRLERLPVLARELTMRRPDVIVVQSHPVVLAVAGATSTIPIVSVASIDPVGAGLTTSLGRPSRNITGFSGFFDTLAPKRLEYLLLIAPRARRVGLLYGEASAREPTEASARALGIVLVPLAVTETAGVIPTLVAAIAQPIDALIVSADPLTYPATAEIVEFTAARRLPAIYSLRQMAVDGGLLALSFDPFEGVRVAADYVARILAGASIASLPFQQPSRILLTVNLRTARRSGIEVPAALIALADEVIE